MVTFSVDLLQKRSTELTPPIMLENTHIKQQTRFKSPQSPGEEGLQIFVTIDQIHDLSEIQRYSLCK